MSRLPLKTRTLTDSEKDFRGVDQVVKLLESAAWVDTPEGGNRVTIYFSSTVPGPSDSDTIWFKKQPDGTPLGIFFPDGAGGYVQVAGPFPGEIKWFGPYNTNNDLPNGWVIADGTGGSTADLSGDFQIASGGLPNYDLIAIQYTGYS